MKKALRKAVAYGICGLLAANVAGCGGSVSEQDNRQTNMENAAEQNALEARHSTRITPSM
ncbi:MAG: hypothetical protein NC307_01005 [Roseburia sp.]|nr:hypothetical protein [Roseburia sp.]